MQKGSCLPEVMHLCLSVVLVWTDSSAMHGVGQGCLELLKRSGVAISGKRAVVLGRSNIVGMPVAHLLQVPSIFLIASALCSAIIFPGMVLLKSAMLPTMPPNMDRLVKAQEGCAGLCFHQRFPFGSLFASMGLLDNKGPPSASMF